MPKTKKEKAKIIENLEEKIKQQKIMIFVNFAGLKSKELFNFRKNLKEKGDDLIVIKKTLGNIVYQKLNIPFDFKKIKEQLAIVFGFSDEIIPAKTIFDFSQKSPNLKILGGILENQFLCPEAIIELSKLPSKNELLTKFLSSLNSPVFNFIFVLKENLRRLIFLLSQISQRSGNNSQNENDRRKN